MFMVFSGELQDLKAQVNGLSFATEGKARYPKLLNGGGSDGTGQFDLAGDVDTGWVAFDRLVNKLAAKANKNPELLLYKLQSNGYKFAWLLIPLSIPFVWLATLGKRGHRFYDHAVFTTYSIAFMSLLFIVVTLASKFNIVPGLITSAAIFYAPFHMYRQLRHAYGSSRIGAVCRLLAVADLHHLHGDCLRAGPDQSGPYRLSVAQSGTEKAPLDIIGQPCRAQRFGIQAAPARFDLGQNVLTASDNRLVKRARTVHFLKHHGGDHLIVEKRRLAIGDLMLQRDPQMLGNRLRRRDRLPVSDNRILHPFEVMGIVDVPHEIDLGSIDGYRVIVANGGGFSHRFRM